MTLLHRWLENRWWGPEEAARHRARRRLAAASWPPGVVDALRRLQEGGRAAGFVGGTVRDVLLGREPAAAVDVAIARTPAEVANLFERVIETGLRHGTVTVLHRGAVLECTTFRREGPYTDARRPDAVAFTDDPLEDLDRRDLTVNALWWDPLAGRLLDPHAGARDLERRRLRAVGEPLERFREDALRPLRVARFRATLEMEPDDALWDAVLAAAREGSGVRFDAVSPERVRAELEALMRAARPSRGFELLSASRLLDRWMPELARARGVTQNRFHAYDVLEHSLRTCDAAPRGKPRVRWGALLHDVGKPVTRAGPEGAATFHGHAEAGAELADALLQRLRFPNQDRAWIVHLVREHMFDVRPGSSDAAIRRWLRRVGVDAVADLFDLRIADALASGVRDGFPAGLEPLRRRIEALLAAEQALAVEDLAIDGRDVMSTLGIAPGPEVGRALALLLDAVLEDPSRNTRENLLATLRERRGQDA